MISNSKIAPQQQIKQRRLNTYLLKRFNNCSINASSIRDSNSLINSHTCLQRKVSKMSTMAADIRNAAVAAATANASSSVQPPMEAVVVNSIIYSKPSFCTIAVDLGNEMDLKNTAWTNLPVPPPPADAKVYRMCTTINGSIQHQISELCDNILAMAGILDVANNDHDDDSLIEFGYQDDDNLCVGDDFDSDDDEDDYVDDEEEDDYENESLDDDDDNDVVDFSYECPIKPAPKLNCDKKKKVHFNTKPTVHYMRAWSYAYRAARKGDWEMYARDRERFKLRIQRAAIILNPILKREHRQKIFEKRFVNLDDNDDDNVVQRLATTKNQQTNVVANVENHTEKTVANEEKSNNESKNPHQKKKRRKKRFCKMGNKHYF